MSDIPILIFENISSWEDWLEKHHRDSDGLWVQFAKKNSDVKSMTYEKALHAALCFGWIDSQAKKHNDTSYLRKFTPRRAKSIWSKNNIKHVEQLQKEGKMKPQGVKEVEDAKKDGRWQNAYDSPSSSSIPEDFLNELKKNKKAYEFFMTLTKTNLYAISWRLQTAKKPQTRMKRMSAILTMLSNSEKFH